MKITLSQWNQIIEALQIAADSVRADSTAQRPKGDGYEMVHSPTDRARMQGKADSFERLAESIKSQEAR